MKISTLILTILVCFSTIVDAQGTQNRANELMKQAQSSLEQKEYTKARYLFIQAYGAFATQENYPKAVECGIQGAALYHRENYYKEAFDLCRGMDQLVWAGEQKQQKQFYPLRFQITKERLQMYIGLKNAAQAKIQLDKLAETAGLAKNDSLSENLLYTQASYYYQCAQPDDHILFARKCVFFLLNDLLAFVILAFQYVQFVLCRHCFYRIGPDDEVLVSAGHQ